MIIYFMSTQQSKYKLDSETTNNFILPIQEKLYREDIIKFLEEQFYLPETNKPIILESWQKKILDKIFNRRQKRDSNLRYYKTALIMIPKKNGKSTLSAGVGLWSLFYDDPNPEVYIVAGDQDQSKIIFKKIVDALRRNNTLYERVNITANLIERKDGRGFLRAVSSDAPTLHGINPSVVIFDELWNQTSEDLFTAVSLPPTRKNPLMFIITYAGYDKDSLLYRLYKDGADGSNRRMFFFHSQKNLSSWVGKEYLEEQKKILHPVEYARLHECRWVDSVDQFFSSSDVDACIDSNLTQQLKGNSQFSYFLGLDLGLKSDRTVISILHYDFNAGIVVLDEMQTWSGTRENPIDIKTIEDFIYDAHQRYNFSKIVVDPWQGIELIQNLKRKNLPIEEFPFSSSNVGKIAQNLYYLFHNKKIRIFNYILLVNELKTAQMVSKSYGYRVDTKTGKHDDHVISLGLASLFAVQHKPQVIPEVWIIGRDN
jgi:phage terminase large subunit-like protein